MIVHNKLSVDCIIPAAGYSSRMGRWKPELPVADGCSLLENAINTALNICERVIIVGGFRFGDLQDMLASYENLIILHNPDYENGMLSSVQTGLMAVEQNFFITPVDMPGIREIHYIKLFEYLPGGQVVRPVFEEKPGHPILCPLSYKEKILNCRGSRLINELRHWDVLKLPWGDDSVIADLDTPEDYHKWEAKGGQ